MNLENYPMVTIISSIIFGLLIGIDYLYYFKTIRKNILNELKVEKKQILTFLVIPIIITISLLVFFFLDLEIIKYKLLLKGFLISFSITSVVFVALMDLLYSEVFLFEMLITETTLVGIPIIYNMFYGCDCISKYNRTCLIIFLLIVFIDNVLNREKSIGTADVDLFSALILGFLTVCLAINEKQTFPIILIGEILSNFSFVLFINIFGYLIIVSGVTLFKKISTDSLIEVKNISENSNEEKKLDETITENNKKFKFASKFRILPAFVLPFVYTALLLYSH